MDDYLLARLRDLARAARKLGDARFSRFLDPSERDLAVRVAREVDVQLGFWGGYEGAERAVAAFYGSGDALEPIGYPIATIEAKWDARYATAEHRDLLGAQMALGLERACLGDIAMGRDLAYLFVMDDSADYVCANLGSAGRARLKLKRVDSPGALVEPSGRTRHVTVHSMRLDAVIAGAYDLSRAEAQRLIARELVKLNHVVTTKVEAAVGEDALISVRGQGRMRVLNAPRENRKGRMALDVMLYGR